MKRHVKLFENYVDPGQIVNAVRTRDAQRVRDLLDAGADPNAVNEFGFTPLYFAVSTVSPQIVRDLVQAGADPSMAVNTNRGRMTPYDLALDLAGGGRLSKAATVRIQEIIATLDQARTNR